MAKARVYWKLGNGEDIQFWTDNWLAQGPLINNQFFERWANVCINQFGSKVINYREGKKWRDLSLISGDLAPIMRMLNPMIMCESKDEIVWGDNPNGLYSVNSGYNTLWNHKEKPPWAKAWIQDLTPKINIFFWLAL